MLRLLTMLGGELADRQQRFAQAGAADISAFRSTTAGGCDTQDRAPARRVRRLRSELRTRPVRPGARSRRKARHGRPLGRAARHCDGRPPRERSEPARRGRRPKSHPAPVRRGRVRPARHRSTRLLGPLGSARTRAERGWPRASGGDRRRDASPGGQAAAIRTLGGHARQRAPGVAASAIGVLPSEVPAIDLGMPRGPGLAVIGRADRDLGPISIDMNEGHFVVAGPLRSGRSTTLATISRSIAMSDDGIALHLLAPRRHPADRARDLDFDIGGP